MSAKTPAEANFWYKKSLETQKLIEDSFKRQKEAEKEKIEHIKNEIKSVEDLEKRVEELSDAIRDVPLLDMENQGVIDYLANVNAELREILELQQQMERNGGGVGGGPLGGWGGGPAQSPFDSSRGGNDTFGQMDGWWDEPEFGGGDFSGGGPAGGWGNPAGGGDIPGCGPAGGWGAMNSGINLPQSFTAQSMQGSHSSLPQAAFGGGMGTTFTTNSSVGSMPITINGGNFDMNKIAESARRQTNNALLRRGA